VDVGLVLARLALAAVFAVAGVAKLRDRPGTRRALADFDVPDRLARRLVLLLPLTEVATAAAVLFASTARWGGLAALALLTLFALGLARALRRGQSPECHCFGQIHSEPVSWLTVARNGALAVPAAYLAGAGPGPSLISWVDASDAEGLGLIATSSLAVLATLTASALWLENRRLRATRAPTPRKSVGVGSRAPTFALPSGDGQLVSLSRLLESARPCVLTFVAPSCGPCVTLLPEVARWSEAMADRLTLSVVTAGDPDAARRLASEYGLGLVLADSASTVSRAYGVPGTPCAIVVGADGTVASSPAAGQAAIEALLRLTVRAASQASAPAAA
jgi:peroxiredoxin/uncharacterized membrane protein YphA (DoxX/SURF4 family)